MAKFRLLEGTHHEHVSHRKFEKGDVVISNRNLMEDFPGKFEAVPDSTPASKGIHENGVPS